MLSYSNFTEKVDLLKMVTNEEKWFVKKWRRKLRGLKEGSVDMQQ
jgi:hypothetical protein